METYFEHLINTVYHTYQDALIKKHSSVYPLRSAVVKFGGFQLSYNWKGKDQTRQRNRGKSNYLHQGNSLKHIVCLSFSRIK